MGAESWEEFVVAVSCQEPRKVLRRRAATKMAHWIYVYCSGICAQGAKLLTVSSTEKQAAQNGPIITVRFGKLTPGGRISIG